MESQWRRNLQSPNLEAVGLNEMNSQSMPPPVPSVALSAALKPLLSKENQKTLYIHARNTVFEDFTEVPVKGSFAIYGGVEVRYKVKDANTFTDTDILKETIAPIYSRLLDEDLIYPFTFGGPFKVECTMIDESTQQHIVRSNGEYRKAILGLDGERLMSILYQTKDINDRKRLLAEIDAQTRIYSEEEVQEFTARTIYCIFVFPTEKYINQALSKRIEPIASLADAYPSLDEFNEVIGYPLFVNEGEFPRWVIQK